MSKTRSAKPRPKKTAPTARKPTPSAKRASRTVAKSVAKSVPVAPREEEEDDAANDDRSGVMCRSCGKRPGRPTAILGQMTQAELCPQCTALRKERIRLNRAAARGLRSSRLF
jgi:NMD protein affecting ribosome stability and mRNA decay